MMVPVLVPKTNWNIMNALIATSFWYYPPSLTPPPTSPLLAYTSLFLPPNLLTKLSLELESFRNIFLLFYYVHYFVIRFIQSLHIMSEIKSTYLLIYLYLWVKGYSIILPSLFIPVSKHFFNLQAWHWLRWALSTTHIPVPAWHLKDNLLL